MRYAQIISVWLVAVFVTASSPMSQSYEEPMTEQQNPALELLEHADSIFQSRDYKAALTAYQQTVEVARAEFNQSVEVEALSQVARMNLLLSDKDAGRASLDEAASRASDSDPAGWSRYLGVRGRFEWQDGDLTKARETFEELYVYCSNHSLVGRAIDAANMMAIVADAFEEKIRWSRIAIEAAERGNEESWLGPLWNNLACTYYDEKMFDDALESFLKAREYHWQHSGEVAKLFADYHVGMVYRSLGKIDEAEQWLRPVLAWAERINNHGAIGQACQDLGEIAIVRGSRDDGLMMLKRARDAYKAAGWDEAVPQIFNDLETRIAELEQ